MRISTAYFAGVGTVIVAVSAGLGGGYLAANITSPPVQAVSKLERRMSAEPISVTTAPTASVPHVAAKTAEANAASAPTQEHPQTQPQPQPQTQPQQQAEVAAPSANAAPPANSARAEEKSANNVATTQPAPSPPPPAKPAEQVSERTAAPQEAFAKTRDTDMKRAAAEQRRAERRQRWADRRRVQEPREQELEAVEERVREVTEPRRIRIREEGEPRETRDLFAEPRRRDMFAEPARTEVPRIRLFDQD
jgi:hypothetical protein